MLHGVALLLVMVGLAAEAVPNSFFQTRPDNCWWSKTVPKTPLPLEVCYWFNDKSCCNPSSDNLVGGSFDGLFAGAGCAPMGHKVRATYRELKEFLCLGCDPDEPRYRFLTAIGDKHLKGGQIAPDPTVASDDYSWRICKSFLVGYNGKQGMWGGNGSKFDICGAKIPNNCQAVTQLGYDPVSKMFINSNVSVLPNGAPCDSTLFTPSADFFDPADDPNDGVPAATRFLNEMLRAQALPNFKFVVVDDTNTTFDFNSTPCFGRRTKASPNAAFGVFSMLMPIAVLLLSALFA